MSGTGSVDLNFCQSLPYSRQPVFLCSATFRAAGPAGSRGDPAPGTDVLYALLDTVCYISARTMLWRPIFCRPTFCRLQAILVLIAMVGVPAATRATQHLSHQPPSHESSGFKTSVNAAPQKVTVSPDVLVLWSIEPADSSVIPAARSIVFFEQFIPSSPTLPAPRSLRAPPSSPFA